MQAQKEDLRTRFLERLLEQAPARVLDVGAGDGALADRIQESGCPVVALEEDGPGFDTRLDRRRWVRASAEALPFRDGAFDWIAMRHVPHHLKHLDRALGEAWRVAGRGLLIAEPWFDETLPDQRFALRADRWLKRQDRRQGRYHGEVLSADELLARLPDEAEAQIETYRPERPWTAEDLEVAAMRATGRLQPEPEDEREFENLLNVARRGRMSLNGTLILTIEKG